MSAHTLFTRAALLAALASITQLACGESMDLSAHDLDSQISLESAEQSASHAAASRLENGSPCSEGSECDSGHCKQIHGQGVCSACMDDASCRESGEGLNCSVAPGEDHARCLAGELAQACEDEESCDDELLCVPVFGSYSSCSECDYDEDCSEDAPHCTTRYNFAADAEEQAGDALPYRGCVAEGSLADGELCDQGESGDAACEGYCVYLPGSRGLATCSSCRPGAGDCAEGLHCALPTITSEGVVAAHCVE